MVHVHGKHDAPSQRSVQACFTKAVLVFSQCDEAFQHCRPVFLVDATFLTGKYKGVLMMAVAVDPDRQLVPLAFALTDRRRKQRQLVLVYEAGAAVCVGSLQASLYDI